MGLDPAPFFANLFSCCKESKWIEKNRRAGIGRARNGFEKVFRFVDDLTALNDISEFERSFWEIYPPELEFKRESLGYLERPFLDHIVTIKDKIFCLKLFDKRDSFPF